MENKILSLEAGNNVLAVAKRLAAEYPEHFVFEQHDNGVFNGEKSFYLSTFSMGSFTLFRFKEEKVEQTGESGDLIVNYSNYAFIDFFNRINYLLDFAKEIEDLIWLVVWSEFLIWHSGNKSLYSRDPMDLLSLAIEDRDKFDKLRMLSAGLYKNKDLEKYDNVPFVFLQRMFDFPDLEKTINDYKAQTIIVSG